MTGRWTFRRGCEQLHKWCARLEPPSPAEMVQARRAPTQAGGNSKTKKKTIQDRIRVFVSCSHFSINIFFSAIVPRHEHQILHWTTCLLRHLVFEPTAVSNYKNKNCCNKRVPEQRRYNLLFQRGDFKNAIARDIKKIGQAANGHKLLNWFGLFSLAILLRGEFCFTSFWLCIVFFYYFFLQKPTLPATKHIPAAKTRNAMEHPITASVPDKIPPKSAAVLCSCFVYAAAFVSE